MIEASKIRDLAKENGDSSPKDVEIISKNHDVTSKNRELTCKNESFSYFGTITGWNHLVKVVRLYWDIKPIANQNVDINQHTWWFHPSYFASWPNTFYSPTCCSTVTSYHAKKVVIFIIICEEYSILLICIYRYMNS